jgi:hypothetical protein
VARTSKGVVAKEKIARFFVSLLHAYLSFSMFNMSHLSRRNVVNILLYVAEQSKRYYPAMEVPAMLSTFIPMLTKDVRFIQIFSD